MADFNFSINDVIQIGRSSYIVNGWIRYKNINDGYVWNEYLLLDQNNYEQRWLSIDNLYDEYAIYKQERSGVKYDADSIERLGYREADAGRQKVLETHGNVDADIGEAADFWEYEDASEENIIAIEKWNGETEYSRGYYLDADEIRVINRNSQSTAGNTNFYAGGGSSYSGGASSGRSSSKAVTSVLVWVIATVLMMFAFVGGIFKNKNEIEDYLKSNSSFTYKTSITSETNSKLKAQVYSTTYSVDSAAKMIIDAIDGNTENVQQNTEDGDNSIAIVTKYEYCLVYLSEDNETLVQISSREFIYGSTSDAYRARRSTRRYYRRYYYSTAYSYDKTKYNNSYDSYSGYNDSRVTTNSTDTYSSYASSVRQSSVASRSSSGGGTSYGK